MEVRCDRCQARYRVDDGRIGPQGLTMRCGKCQNTFKVMRPAGEANAAPATQRPATPSRPATAPPTANEGAGRTMMFQTAPVKAPPAPKPASGSGPSRTGGEPRSGSTIVFGAAPASGAGEPVSSSAPPPGPRNDVAGSTMMFGASPAAQKPGNPMVPPPAVTTQPDAVPLHGARGPMLDSDMADARTEMSPPAPLNEMTADGPHAGVEAEGAERRQGPSVAPGTFDRAPPKSLIIGVAATVLVLLLAAVGLVVWKKTARRPPPAAAVETLTSAQADAAKDTLASLASAETKARDAIEVAGPRSRFPEAVAALAGIEVQWADALNDQAARLTARDPGDAKAAALQDQAKTKLKAAFEALSPAIKAQPKSPELQLAYADYHRAQRSTSGMNKALRNSGAPRDDPRIAAIQGLALVQDEDGADKAVPKLKAALSAAPQSARLHYRLAQAYAGIKDEGSARAELKEVLRISPQHERARALLDQLAAQPSTGNR